MPALSDTRALQISPPAGATMWGLTRQLQKTRPGTGQKYNASEPVFAPEPDGEGSRIAHWPIAEFSKARVLEIWGPGKYRVHWYDSKGQKMAAELSVTFEVVETAKRKKGARLRGADAVEVEADAEIVGAGGGGGMTAILARAAKGGGIGVVDLFTLLHAERAQSRDDVERARERERQEADARRQQDREFFQMQMTMFAQVTGARAAAPEVNLSAELALIRREMNLAAREGQAELRAELRKRMRELEQLAAEREEEPEPDPDDPEDPPEDLEEAGTMLLQKLWRELAGDGQLGPKIMQALQRLNLSPAEQEKLAQVVQTNGAPRA